MTITIFYYASGYKLVRKQTFKTRGGYALFELIRTQAVIAGKEGLVIKSGGVFGA